MIVLLYGFKSETVKDQFQKMKTMTQIIRLISENYVEDVDMNDILEGAIIGLLDRLDPHSNYISEEQLELINEQFDGEFEGIGIEFSLLDGYITVISPIPGTPSDRAGLQSGDRITQINNESAYKITQKDVMKKLRGPKGSHVDISIARIGLEEEFEVTLVRDKIPIVSVLAHFMIVLSRLPLFQTLSWKQLGLYLIQQGNSRIIGGNSGSLACGCHPIIWPHYLLLPSPLTPPTLWQRPGNTEPEKGMAV